MTNKLKVSKKLTNQGWSVTAKVEAGGSIPADIFVYTNSGTTALGEFEAVVSILDMPKIPVWNSTAITPRLKYVRANVMNKIITDGSDVDLFISRLVSSVKKFTQDYSSVKETSEIYVLD